MNGISAAGKAGILTNSVNGKTQKSSLPDFTNSFSSVMDQNRKLSSGNGINNHVKTKKTEVKSDFNTASKENMHVDEKTVRSKDTETNNQIQSVNEESNETLNEEVNEIVSELAKEFGVTEEELVNAMELLGLSLADLTNVANMAKLAENFMQEVDSISLVTDEALFHRISELSNMVTEGIQNIESEFGFSADEIEMAFSEMADELKSTDKSLQEMETELLKQQGIGDSESKDTAMVSKNVHVNEEADEFALQNEKNRDSSKTDMEASDTELNSKNSSFKIEVEQSDASKDQTQNEESENFQGTFHRDGKVLTEKGEFVPKAETPIPVADPQSILDQIGEYVKISNKSDLTQMEMQLNPESLGTIHLQVSAKEGVVTAQITTQNESVKQALETQIVQLRERLEAQGVKVDAVEVAIASHEFERNLNQGEHKEQNHQVKKTTRRKINLNDPMEDTGEFEETEADKLQKDIMIENGNTVDYTA